MYMYVFCRKVVTCTCISDFIICVASQIYIHVYVHMWVYTYSTFIQNWVVIPRLDGTIPVGILSEAVQYQLHLHVHVHVIIGYQ